MLSDQTIKLIREMLREWKIEREITDEEIQKIASQFDDGSRPDHELAMLVITQFK